MAIQTMQTRFTNHLRTIRSWLPRAIALLITPLGLGSCAELVDLQTDLSRLRADLHITTETLSKLSARVDEIERRQAATDSTVRQTQQELTRAIEVLLKKALVTEDRLTTESGRSQSKGTEKPDGQARQQPSETQRTALQGGNSPPGGKHISLGMTQEDVRRTLGDPLSIDDAGSYIFWQYSQMSNQKYVVFDKVTRQVWGWRGL